MKVAKYVSFSKVPYGRRSQGLVWLIHRPYESTQIQPIQGSRVMNRLDSRLRYNTLSISLDRTMRETKHNEIIIYYYCHQIFVGRSRGERAMRLEKGHRYLMRLLESGKDYSTFITDSTNSCKLIKADLVYLQKQYYYSETRFLGLNTSSTIC